MILGIFIVFVKPIFERSRGHVPPSPPPPQSAPAEDAKPYNYIPTGRKTSPQIQAERPMLYIPAELSDKIMLLETLARSVFYIVTGRHLCCPVKKKLVV